jgi:hypothetical protein
MLAARAAIGSAILALAALTAVHLLKRDLDPSRTMISRYALGSYGWVMAVCFAGWSVATALLFVALIPLPLPVPERVGQSFLPIASLGLALAALFPMDPAGTPRHKMSRAGKMHGIAFLVGVPALVLAVAGLQISLHRGASQTGLPLQVLGVAIWMSLIAMIALAKKVGADHGPNPKVPRLFGWSNRMLMVSYTLWLIAMAWPIAF